MINEWKNMIKITKYLKHFVYISFLKFKTFFILTTMFLSIQKIIERILKRVENFKIMLINLENF